MNVFSGPPGKGNFRAPIDPKGITLPETESLLLEGDAARLRRAGGDISTAGDDITSSWAGLTGCYSAPEDETLFAVLNPVATDGDDVDTALDSAATALETFAETARRLRARLLVLRGRAEAFNESVRGDEDWDQGGFFGGGNDKVDELAGLRSDIARAQEEFTAAEIECANAITALVPGGTHFKSAEADGSTTVGENEFVYGLTEIPDDMATAWGPPATTDHRWWVDATHAGWDWAAGGVVDIAGMTGTYHEGQWGVPIVLFGPMMPLIRSQGQANFQNYWGDTLTGAATLTGFYQGQGPPRFDADDNPLTRPYAWEWDGWHIPESRQAWEENVSSAAIEAAHGSVSWREWEQRPGYVLTQGTITGVTVAAGGFGLVKGGLGGLRALGRGDFDVNALSPDALRDLMRGATLRPDGSTGSVPQPNANSADDHRDPDQLGSARDTLDELASHTAQPTAPAPTPPTPPGRGDTEPTAPPPPERAETVAPPPGRGGSDENTPAQDPTAQQVATQAALEDMLREDPSLAEVLHPDLVELLRTNGPDRPWVASPFREADGDGRVLAGVGGRGDDTLTESADTPAPTQGRSLDLTDIGDLRPNDQSPDSSPDLRDTTPTITNNSGDGGTTARHDTADNGRPVVRDDTSGPGDATGGRPRPLTSSATPQPNSGLPDTDVPRDGVDRDQSPHEGMPGDDRAGSDHDGDDGSRPDPDGSDRGDDAPDPSVSHEESGTKPKREKPDWVRNLLEPGNEFNRKREPYYTARGGVNELFVGEITPKGGYRSVDSYIPNEEIVSRKYTQLAEVKEDTVFGYLGYQARYYSPGTIIPDLPSARQKLQQDSVDSTLQGEMILEVPV